MSLLKPHQINVIESDVEQARLTIINLSDELIDHICCEVEFQMEKNGKSFEEAYSLIKEETGIKVLQKIQENALYLIDKKYALMKTTMKITGNVSLALLAVGTVFKIQHWPGANFMLLIGFVLLALVFFPAAIYVSNKEGKLKNKPVLNGSILIGGIVFILGILFKVMHWPGSTPMLLFGWIIILGIFMPILLITKIREGASTKEKVSYVLGAIALIIFELGVMFKMFHWPGASLFMLIGAVLLVGVFIPIYSKLKFENSSISIGKFIFLITLSMYAVVLTFMLAMNVSRNFLAHFDKAETNASLVSNYFRIKKEIQLKNFKALPDSLKKNRESRMLAINSQAEALYSQIYKIKMTLVQQTEGVDEASAVDMLNNLATITRKDNYDWVNHIMLGEIGDGLARGLKDGIEKFKKVVAKDSVATNDINNATNILLNTSSEKTEEGDLTWEFKTFRNTPLISALVKLSAIEKRARIIESNMITRLSK